MFHLALDGPFIFRNIVHCYKRDHLHVVAKLLSDQHSLDRGKLSDTCASWNTRSPRTQGKAASEQWVAWEQRMWSQSPITTDTAANLTGKS